MTDHPTSKPLRLACTLFDKCTECGKPLDFAKDSYGLGFEVIHPEPCAAWLARNSLCFAGAGTLGWVNHVG